MLILSHFTSNVSNSRAVQETTPHSCSRIHSVIISSWHTIWTKSVCCALIIICKAWFLEFTALNLLDTLEKIATLPFSILWNWQNCTILLSNLWSSQIHRFSFRNISNHTPNTEISLSNSKSKLFAAHGKSHSPIDVIGKRFYAKYNLLDVYKLKAQQINALHYANDLLSIYKASESGENSHSFALIPSKVNIHTRTYFLNINTLFWILSFFMVVLAYTYIDIRNCLQSNGYHIVALRMLL